MEKQIKQISKLVVPGTYECDECGDLGDITNMIHVTGKGVIHVKCFNKKNR